MIFLLPPGLQHIDDAYSPSMAETVPAEHL